MSKMHDYIDEFGVIAGGPFIYEGEEHRDGGDSCQRRFMYRVGCALRERMGISNEGWWRPTKTDAILDSYKFFQNGQIRRHPNGDKWFGQWDRGSRDQTTPFICWCGIDKQHSKAIQYIKAHFFRFGWIERVGEKILPFKIPVWLPMLTTNSWIRNWVDMDAELDPIDEWKKKRKIPDFTFLEFWALEIRALGLWQLYPLLIFLDIENFIGSIVWRFGRKKDNDVLNHVVITCYTKYVMPTPLSYLSGKVLDWGVMSKKMHTYFNFFPQSISDMYTLWEPIMKNMK